MGSRTYAQDKSIIMCLTKFRRLPRSQALPQNVIKGGDASRLEGRQQPT
ncbi:MAG: hypothetical protein DSM106950_24425 [Stigonema ocellatum SAG 48.90 = DSM 106950]|nr:hypothetical protein [Stigonema ocellatum SAG 48.90 = DSM 106950]